jgi:PKD repeat protein
MVDGPPQTDIFRSVDGKQVAFTALVIGADSYQWDFGDGNTSTETNPVHVYESGGIYTITLTATNGQGSSQATTQVELDLTPFEMLTGGANAVNGKSWKISSNHSALDAFAVVDAGFTTIQAIPTGALSNPLGYGEEYDDTFTFKADGSYIHDNKNGGSFGSLVHALTAGIPPVNLSEAGQQFGLASLSFTPEAGATFTYTEGDDYTFIAINALDGSVGEITYSNVTTLDFSGEEFIGLMSPFRKVIVQELTPEKMRLVMFLSVVPEAPQVPSAALILTFDAVN